MGSGSRGIRATVMGWAFAGVVAVGLAAPGRGFGGQLHGPRHFTAATKSSCTIDNYLTGGPRRRDRGPWRNLQAM